jgi:hypothetical protein
MPFTVLANSPGPIISLNVIGEKSSLIALSIFSTMISHIVMYSPFTRVIGFSRATWLLFLNKTMPIPYPSFFLISPIAILNSAFTPPYGSRPQALYQHVPGFYATYVHSFPLMSRAILFALEGPPFLPPRVGLMNALKHLVVGLRTLSKFTFAKILCFCKPYIMATQSPNATLLSCCADLFIFISPPTRPSNPTFVMGYRFGPRSSAFGNACLGRRLPSECRILAIIILRESSSGATSISLSKVRTKVNTAHTCLPLLIHISHRLPDVARYPLIVGSSAC